MRFRRRSIWDEPPAVGAAPAEVSESRTAAAWPPSRKRTMWQYLRLLKYARPEWKKVVLLVGSMLSLVALELVRPWPMKVLVDNVLKKGSSVGGGFVEALPGEPTRDTLLFLVVISTLLIFILITVVGMLNAVSSVSVGQRMTYGLGADLFLHMQRMSLLFHVRRPVGDSIARVTGDPYAAQLLLNGAILPVLQSVITISAMFFIMWRLDPTMTLLSMAVVPFIVYTIQRFKGPMKDRSRVTVDLEGDLMSVVQQSLNAIPLVQAFNKEDAEHARFRGYADRAVMAYVRSTMTDMWFKLFAGLSTAAGTALLIWVGSRAVFEGRLSLGTLLVFLAYLAALYGPLNQMTYTVSTLQHAAAQADRILDIIELPLDVVEAEDAKEIRLQGRVAYEHVTFGYEPDRPVLHDISFVAQPGEVTALVGPTGAGKSTLVNMLVRFFDPAAGRILIDGHDIRGLRLSSLREQMAIVLQDPFIFPMSVAENISYGRPDASRAEVEAAAKAANADEFIKRLRQGYDTIIGERGATLSGGEKQRISIARAFLKDAPLLILDEPTSSLDTRTEASLMAAMRRLMEGRVTFVIAHRLSTIRNADQILVLDEGRIVESGTHGELLFKRGLYSSLYSEQIDIADHDAAGGTIVLDPQGRSTTLSDGGTA
ncbi:MAG: ABC transporter ATP-binding protein [Actinomycetota bacterium]